ncbi:uncharacterized protein E0L32_006483 [Thyridium curvatum]|uniref:SCP domain-containing protein n=1 Tax=Thyridium curvatum TaxID=1093900 RepID=A0A507B010_9PEZI|nr:uncharacterized protein E0L32_006483 [Thyridium curvatum]TPX13057.1 hypothetical protein E0L32_006483 [Thyridium curvatum]
MYFKISTVFTTALLLLTEITSAAPAVSADQANVLEARALTSDQQMALNVHNSARSSRRVPALQWDASLASAAQSYANTLASTGQFKHSGVGGENLFYERGGTYPQPLLDASKAWIAEKPNYHNEVIPQGNFEAYGHYTQCVWKGTTKVGIASAKGANGAVYVVARYSPAGNIVGQRPY